MDEFDLKINMGLILRGNLRDMERILSVVKQELGDSVLLFKEVSADKLWIEKDGWSKSKEKYDDKQKYDDNPNIKGTFI